MQWRFVTVVALVSVTAVSVVARREHGNDARAIPGPRVETLSLKAPFALFDSAKLIIRLAYCCRITPFCISELMSLHRSESGFRVADLLPPSPGA